MIFNLFLDEKANYIKFWKIKINVFLVKLGIINKYGRDNISIFISVELTCEQENLLCDNPKGL